MHRISNRDIANMLTEMAALYAMDDTPFKPAAYERAALSIAALDREVADIYKKEGPEGFLSIAGVGQGIAGHIEELLIKGHFTEYERLKKKMPVEISELTAVEGVGPKMIKILWQKLGIQNLKDLEKAAKEGRIRALPHFGKKSEQKILRGIEFLRSAGGRQILGFILPEVRTLESRIRALPGVERAVVVGSVMRRKETIGDIDILAISSKPEIVMEQFVRLPMIAHVYDKGRTKTNVRLKNGLDADLRVVPKESFGAAMNYFIGSKEHGIALREIAIKKGMKLNEYGLFKGTRRVAGEREEEIYKALGLDYVEPELRENTGEIAAAREGQLPRIINYRDLKGDLQTQTNWTDGSHSIEQMADAAENAGLAYIAITDHTRSLAMTKGSDEKRLREQMDEIDTINAKRRKEGKRTLILKGAEVNILKDGSLDIDDDTLKKLDIAGASIHSHFALLREEQTRRVIRAMENPHIDIIFHLTGRVINRRAPIQLDIDAVIQAAKRTGTILEINAYPDRLDIKDDYIRKCVEAGVRMSIDSDAHSVHHFVHLEMGIAQARRGWAEKKDIINAWPLEKMKKFLKRNQLGH